MNKISLSELCEFYLEISSSSFPLWLFSEISVLVGEERNSWRSDMKTSKSCCWNRSNFTSIHELLARKLVQTGSISKYSHYNIMQKMNIDFKWILIFHLKETNALQPYFNFSNLARMSLILFLLYCPKINKSLIVWTLYTFEFYQYFSCFAYIL